MIITYNSTIISKDGETTTIKYDTFNSMKFRKVFNFSDESEVRQIEQQNRSSTMSYPSTETWVYDYSNIQTFLFRQGTANFVYPRNSLVTFQFYQDLDSIF